MMRLKGVVVHCAGHGPSALVEEDDQGPLVRYTDARDALAAKDAEIAKLRAELDTERQRASDWSAACVRQRKRAEDAESALAAARSALDKALDDACAEADEFNLRLRKSATALKDCCDSLAAARAALKVERDAKGTT